MKIIFTSQSYPIAAREWRDAFSCECTLLAEGIGVADVDADYADVCATARNLPLVFTRHMFPVCADLPAHTSPEAALEDVLQRLDSARSYSVQARSATGNAPTRPLSEALQARGYTLDIRNPEQVVSVYDAPGAVYVGVSDAHDNLSDWNGGMMHFSSRELICRAECKLLEAIRVFSLPIGPGMKALDLGAAPGGWSNALAQRGAAVTAVDPAELDARVAPLVSHMRMTTQDFLAQSEDAYDLIVNDMKMDALRALEWMYRFKPHLSPDGAIVSTLKLPKSNGLGAVKQCLRSIREQGELLGARQLFHNRSEITVYFR